MSADRGKVLLSVPLMPRVVRIVILVVIAAALATTLVLITTKKLNPALFAVWAGLFPVFLRRRVTLYENGVQFTAAEDNRFVKWHQLEGWHWDGGNVVLVGIKRVLEGGPVENAIIRVPDSHRQQVEAIVAVRTGKAPA